VALAAKVAPLLSLLAMGYLLNMLMWIPFETQLAHGSVKLPMKINIVAVLFITPTIMVLTPQFGSQGAAWAWILLNTGYVLIGVHFMFRKVLPDQKWNWYLDDVLKPLFPPAIIMTIAKPWIPQTATLVGEVAILLIYAVVAVGMSIVFAKRIRLDFFKLITDFPRLFIIRK
jgi:O-antigen/teichoic acid export membrane protein